MRHKFHKKFQKFLEDIWTFIETRGRVPGQTYLPTLWVGIYSSFPLGRGTNFFPKIILFDLGDYPPYMTF